MYVSYRWNIKIVQLISEDIFLKQNFYLTNLFWITHSLIFGRWLTKLIILKVYQWKIPLKKKNDNEDKNDKRDRVVALSVVTNRQ